MSKNLEIVLSYHEATKHSLKSYARSPGRLDWANQPDPFRRYLGSSFKALPRAALEDYPIDAPAQLSAQSISQLLFNSLALSAWKRSGISTWSLRVNPSSGNLHPTEGYLVTGPVEGITNQPAVFHYAPDVHGLELIANLESEKWNWLGFPDSTLLLVLTSIYWRESWKYGERAFRYCMLDAGHAIAAISIAAACLGWTTAILEDPATTDLEALLGLPFRESEEAEHPDCLLAVFADGEIHQLRLQEGALSGLNIKSLSAKPNVLSPEHVEWSIIDNVAKATIKPPSKAVYGLQPSKSLLDTKDICRHLRKRRSAQAMDEESSLERDMFYRMLKLIMPGRLPFSAFPWRPLVHLVIWANRVQDLERGIYMLVRHESQIDGIREAMNMDFSWEKPEGCPSYLDLYLLKAGDVRDVARQASCHQSIASDGCFCSAMLTEFEEPLKNFGPWFYRRLFWECGAVGQMLYLASEVLGIRGCGIGCFFDDFVHDQLGLKGWTYQNLYHFTVGKALEDSRISSHPGYLWETLNEQMV